MNSNTNIDFLDLQEEEEVLEKSYGMFHFPAVTVSAHYRLYFNQPCVPLFAEDYIRVSKTASLLIFRPVTRRTDAFKKTKGHRSGFSVSATEIKTMGFRPRDSFKLYRVNGGYAIKRYEPIKEGMYDAG